MADQQVKIDLEENSKYRVAWDLMERIANFEDDPAIGTEREYYLRLYRQCYESVRCYKSIEDVVKAKPLTTDAMGLRY